MARIGLNSRLPIPAGRWQVHFGNMIRVPGTSPQDGGGLGFWYVHEVIRRDIPPFRKFRVQRDAVEWANVMNARAP
jgi:hypothetical protein